MTSPSIKKNADGTWTVVGVQERNITQSQADYEELIKAAQLLPGGSGDTARAILSTNPGISNGMFAGLVKNGALPDNPLSQTLIEIDKQTQAERAKNAFEEAQRIANEKFAKSWRGKFWNYTKAAVRGITVAAETPFEMLGGALRISRQAISSLAQGDWTGQKTGFPTGDDQRRELIFQTKGGQIGKAIKEGKSIDFGQGFFPSEETGLGFAARQEKMKAAKVVVQLDNNRTYERPYSFADPILELLPFKGIKPETEAGSLVSAVGDLAALIAFDPGLAYSKAKKARDLLERTARISEGKKAAKAYADLAVADAQLADMVKETNDAIEAWKSSTGLKKVLNEKNVRDSITKQMQTADALDNTVLNPDAIANFISSSNGSPIVNAIADMDFKQIYAIGKKGGKRGGFSVDQARDLAAATTKEEVLQVLAKYINNGEVVADVLESGTKIGNAVRGLVNSKIVPGAVAKMAGSISGLAARNVAKVPYYTKIVNTFERLNDTVVETGRLIHASDKDAMVEAIYNYGRATNLDANVIDDLVKTVVYSDSSASVGYAATGKLFDAIFAKNAALAGVDAEALKEATRVFENGRKQMASYWASRHMEGAKIDFVVGKGKVLKLDGPHLDSELLNSSVYLPPVQDILDLINFTARLPKFGKQAEYAKEVADFFTTNVWKRLVLIRPAYIIRNIAEEQIRVLATGHVSFFNNPLTAVAMAVGNPASDSAFKRFMARFDPYKNTIMGDSFKLGETVDEVAAEVAAHDVVDSYINFMKSKGVSSMDYNDVTTTMRFAGVSAVKYGHPRWWEGAASEIRILSNSIAGRAVARTKLGYEQGTVDFLLRGGGKKDWETFANAQKADVRDWLLSDEGAMQYLFTGKNERGISVSLRARIDEVAGADGEASQAIKNLIAYGKIQGEGFSIAVPKGLQSAENSIKNAESIAKKGKSLKDVNQEFAAVLQKAFDGKGNWDDLEMNVPIAEFKRLKKDGGGKVNQISDWFFDVATKIEKNSTMGPEWRQKYWDAIYDIAGSLDADAVSRLKKVAQDSLTPLKTWKGQSIGAQHKVWQALEQVKEGGNVTAEMANKYASHVANTHVKDLFYDASRKRLLFHQLRLVLPFGQAWEDTIKAWAKLALNNPMQIYKVQKPLQWLTKPESSALYQLTDAKDYYDPNQGFFWTDPKDGQLKFFLPFLATGMNFLSNLALGRPATGGPVALSATPQSLNFAFASGSIIPGVGPGLSMSVAVLDNAGMNPLKLVPAPLRELAYNFIFPFGDPTFKQGFIEAFLPNNWRRIMAPFGTIDAGYASAFGPTMNYLASGGNYDLYDPVDQDRLLRDTDKFAKWFTFWRGVTGTISPFPPQMTNITKLDDGNVVLNTALYESFKQFEVNAGGDKTKAYKDFMDLYGPDKIFSIISASTGGPTNLYTYELVKNNPDIVDKYPDIYGYAYPGGGYSTELYRWQQKFANKQPITKDELLSRATAILYNAAKDTLLARSNGEGWSSDQYNEASRNLRKVFYQSGMKQPVDVARKGRVMEQLRSMALDERFNDSEAVQGLRDYMYLRDEAIKAYGGTTDSLKASGALAQREWLAGKAKEIISDYPDFQNMFYAFFKSELEGN